MIVLAACKGSEKKQAPPPPAPPRVSTFPALPPAPTATLDPPEVKAEFPQEQPAIAMWSGGGEMPKTTMSVRVWADGTVRFRCGRRGKIPAERVAAMLSTFDQQGWMPAPVPAGEGKMADKAPDPNCQTTSVQLGRDGNVKRHNSACGTISESLTDAVEFVRAVVGPDPCP